MRKTLALTLATLLGAVASPALADLQPWGHSGNWDILVDPSLGNGCLIQASFTDGSLVRIGFDRTAGGGYVTTFNADWGDITEGQSYDITYDLDGQSYDGQAKGLYLNGVPGADVAFDSADFLMDIARKQTMTLYHQDARVLAIDLTDSYTALQGALQCQDEQG